VDTILDQLARWDFDAYLGSFSDRDYSAGTIMLMVRQDAREVFPRLRKRWNTSIPSLHRFNPCTVVYENQRQVTLITVEKQLEVAYPASIFSSES
jgi:hypothetical protein